MYDYRPIIIIIINTAVINENLEAALFHAPIFKNNLFNAKYVSSHVFTYKPQRNISAPIMPFLRLLILFYESPKTGLHASKVKKHFNFLKK